MTFAALFFPWAPHLGAETLHEDTKDGYALDFMCDLATPPHSIEVVDLRAELVEMDMHKIMPRQGSPDSPCTNTPKTRGCWGEGYSIATNYDAEGPMTGRVVSYELEVQNVTDFAPDGVVRPMMVINGQYPGPTIRAQWGDTLQITVYNNLQANGTSMHWHGVRQRNTNTMDGTNGITECPLAPGAVRTYTFLCTQFGTTWYHSHYSNQYSDGVVGTIIIDGPATANYDVDLGTYPITDWYYIPSFELGPLIQHGAFPAGPPPGDNILINGTNVNTVDSDNPGEYSRVKLAKGTSYRLRIINTSTNDNFKIGLDGHLIQVISADFVPIRPFYTDWLFMAIGQRYDIVIHANEIVASYWFHVVPQDGCASNLNTNALAIFEYEGADSDTPPDEDRKNAPPTSDCADPNDLLVPFVKLNVPENGRTMPDSVGLDVGFAVTQDSNQVTNVQWPLNFSAIQVPWQNPTLRRVLDNDFNFAPDMNVITLPHANIWSIWVIQAVATAVPPIPHPIHLHGHDFYILGAGTGIFNNSEALTYKNPPRRDVALLPAAGYLVVAFITDNPGAWLVHCHIAWHISLGLGAQFLVRASDIPTAIPFPNDWFDECATWHDYYQNTIYKESDSGL
ncbi:hypothetical protein DV736_g3991, partial [Chaetothyriales sp. CBS 134916]